MTILNELQVLSYNGVEMLFISNDTVGGKKIVTHEYPLQNFRFTEDLGKLDKKFSLQVTVRGSKNAIISADGTVVVPAQDLKNNMDALIQELDKQGPGQLTLPIFGTITAQVGVYTISHSIRNLGRPIFTIPFEQTEPSILPAPTQDNANQITQTAQKVLEDTQIAIENNYLSPANIFQNIQDASNKIISFVDDVETESRKLSELSQNISEFSAIINSIKADINAIVVSPIQVALSINSVFQVTQTLFENPLDVFTFYQGLFAFGDDDIEIQNLSQTRADLITNRTVLNDNIQASALALAYQSIVSIDFQNTDVLHTIRDSLEDEFQRINNKKNIDFDVKEILFDLRDEVEIFLERQETILPNVETVRVYNTPISALVYQYYGNLDRLEQILDLNPQITNPSFFDGDINILKD